MIPGRRLSRAVQSSAKTDRQEGRSTTLDRMVLEPLWTVDTGHGRTMGHASTIHTQEEPRGIPSGILEGLANQQHRYQTSTVSVRSIDATRLGPRVSGGGAVAELRAGAHPKQHRRPSRHRQRRNWNKISDTDRAWHCHIFTEIAGCPVSGNKSIGCWLCWRCLEGEDRFVVGEVHVSTETSAVS